LFSYPDKTSISLGVFSGRNPLEIVREESLRDLLSVIQICPQNSGITTVETIDDINLLKPDSEIRLHANVKVFDPYVWRRRGNPPLSMADASRYRHPKFKEYWDTLVPIIQHIGNPYTFHAGSRVGSTLEQVLASVGDLEQRVGSPVGIEGMYPTCKNSYIMSTMDEYRKVMESGVHYCVDLSHLNIIRHYEGGLDESLVQEMLLSCNCIEIHISGNNGISDSHKGIDGNEWWIKLVHHDLIKASLITEEAGGLQ